jgi:hypothetical protein
MYQLQNFSYIIIRGKQKQQDPIKISREKIKFINMQKMSSQQDGYLVSTIQCVVYYVQHKVIQTSSISNQLCFSAAHTRKDSVHTHNRGRKLASNLHLDSAE